MCVQDAWERVEKGRQVIDQILASGEVCCSFPLQGLKKISAASRCCCVQVVYGINTGFGNFAQVKIEASQVDQLQLNLIRSHWLAFFPPPPFFFLKVF
jgi:histidine ammonia-lyase